MQAHTWVLFMGRVEAHLPEATSAHVALIESQSQCYALAILLTVALKAALESWVGSIWSWFRGERQGPWLHLAQTCVAERQWIGGCEGGRHFFCCQQACSAAAITWKSHIYSILLGCAWSYITLHAEVFSALLFSKFLSQINFWPPRRWPPLRTYG